MKVDILGTEYTIIKDSAKTNSKLVNADAYVEFNTKEIIMDKDLYKDSFDTIKKIDIFKNKVFRHEIIHAYFHESGLCYLENNEIVVDWIASQYPKLKKTFKKLKIEE